MKPKGLHYFDDFLTLEEEKDLLRVIDEEVWDTQLSRRVQHCG